jgi:hypothetical protein
MSNETISTWGYHAVEGARLFVLKLGEALPVGWHDSPAKLPPRDEQPAADAPAKSTPAAPAVSPAEFAQLREQVDDLRKSLGDAVDRAVDRVLKAAVDEAVTPLREQLQAIGDFAREMAGGEKPQAAKGEGVLEALAESPPAPAA